MCPVQGSSFDQALQLMGQSAPGILAAQPHGLPVEQYQPSTFVSRLSVKLFNCVPGNLPLDLRDKLTGWLHSTPAGAEGVPYSPAPCLCEAQAYPGVLFVGIKPLQSMLGCAALGLHGSDTCACL